jgi:hypothetical protein
MLTHSSSLPVSLSHSLTHSLTHSFTSPTHSLTHFTHSLTHSPHPLTHSLTHLLTHLLTHSRSLTLTEQQREHGAVLAALEATAKALYVVRNKTPKKTIVDLKAKEKVCALCLYRLFFYTRPSYYIRKDRVSVGVCCVIGRRGVVVD